MTPRPKQKSFTVTSTDLPSPDMSLDSRVGQGTSYLWQSEISPSLSDEATSQTRLTERAIAKSKTPRWLAHVKDWISVSEPSAQAMKEQRTTVYKRHGVDFKDPQAAAKLHFPIGQLPAGTTTSTKGPSPEKARERAKEKQMRRSFAHQTHQSRVYSSSDGSSERSILRDSRSVAPWDT